MGMNKLLAQDEVEALLRGLLGGEAESDGYASRKNFGIAVFDLANRKRLVCMRIPALEVMNYRLARLCTNILAKNARNRSELSSQFRI